MAISASRGDPIYPRARGDVARFFVGTDLIAPGLTSIVDWHPDDEPRPRTSARETAVYGAVARLP
jgi:hypothetical protein